MDAEAPLLGGNGYSRPNPLISVLAPDARTSVYLGDAHMRDDNGKKGIRSRASVELSAFRNRVQSETLVRKVPQTAPATEASEATQAPKGDFEGMDYWEPFNAERRKFIAEHHANAKSSLKWGLFALTGVIVALLSIFMKQTVERVVIFRFRSLHDALGVPGASPSLPGNETSPPYDVSGTSYFGACVFWVLTSGVFIVVSSCLVVFVEPKAAGSGMPEVMSYLNGVQVGEYSLKVMVVKFFSCLLAVASGLPVGPEGPMIQIGSVVGTYLTQPPHGWMFAGVASFRNTMDRRAFVTCGAAAGVSAAFGAPVGGLLFVMEETAAYWDRSLTWMIFFTTTLAFFIEVLFNSVFHGWEPTGYTFGSLVEEAVVLFQPEIVLTTVNLNLFVIFPSIIIGLICGFFAVIFTRMNLKVMQWRKTAVDTKWKRIAEPLVLTVVYTTASFLLPLMSSCSTMPLAASFHGEQIVINQNDFAQFDCAADNQYSPLATLTLNSGENSIRHLFSRGTRGQFHAGALLGYLVLYFIFAALSAGSSFSAGIAIPQLVIGSTIGRMIAEFLHDVVPMFNDYDWFDPGLFALIGAAAFFAGVSRLTLSLAVIMLEISHEVYFLPPMMIAIMMAKWSADFKEPYSLYHALIHLEKIPFLDGGIEASMNYELFTAEDVMSSPVAALEEDEQMGRIFEALATTHAGFPVVNRKRQLKGWVLRAQLETIVARLGLDEEGADESRVLTSGGDCSTYLHDLIGDVRQNQTDEVINVASHNKRRVSLLKRRDTITHDIFTFRVNLAPIMSTSPFVVHKNFRFNLTRIIFQAMSMRHLVVVTTNYRVVGVITRKNIIQMDQDIAAFRALYEDRSEPSTDDEEDPPRAESPSLDMSVDLGCPKVSSTESSDSEEGAAALSSPAGQLAQRRQGDLSSLLYSPSSPPRGGAVQSEPGRLGWQHTNDKTPIGAGLTGPVPMVGVEGGVHGAGLGGGGGGLRNIAGLHPAPSYEGVYLPDQYRYNASPYTAYMTPPVLL